MKKNHYSIMFADIVASTAVYEMLGDREATECISKGIARMVQISRDNAGRIENIIGDEVLAIFKQPDDAVTAAIKLHRDFQIKPVHQGVSLKLRIGIHYGPVLGKGDSLSGDAVNTAARVASIATADKVIITEQMQSKLSDKYSGITRKFDVTEIKGKKGHIILYDCIWGDDHTVAQLTGKPVTPGNHQLILKYGGQKLVMRPEDRAVDIGRNQSSSLIIDTDLVSREHARCVYRRGKFILIDQSTNGTYLKSGGEREVYLRREEVPLIGRGTISLGDSAACDTGQVIEFIAT